MKKLILPLFMTGITTMCFLVASFAQEESPQPVAQFTDSAVEEAIVEPEEKDEFLTSPSGLTAEDLCLLYELKGYEQVFIDAEKEHGVRADFLAAVAALESGWGRYQFFPNNVMGFGQRSFSSVRECVNTVAAFLAEHYLASDGQYYNGATVEGVCVYYNGRTEWALEVSQLMNRIRGDETDMTTGSYSPIQEAYNVLLSYMDGTEDNEAYVIETALGYLGEALDE